jgi:hypothetical protein
MQSLREINLDLGDTTRIVDDIDRKFGKKKVGFSDEEQKKLLDDIDKNLDKTDKESSRSQDKKPRNYHPPDSPVRRVYENGVEQNNGGSQMRDRSSP